MKLPLTPVFSQLSQRNLKKELPIFFCLFGVLVRTIQYLANRSLWLDESYLALNLVNRSYTELLQPLDYNQAAPVGFLLTEKFITQVFGNFEYALRLFPFLCSLLAIFFFYKLAKQVVSGWALVAATLLFACLSRLIYFSVELKQYSSDVMIALLLTLLLMRSRNIVLTLRHAIFLGVVGAIAIWFSHPAIFILAGVELAQLLLTQRKQLKAYCLSRLPTYLMWLVSFGFLYLFTVTTTLDSEELLAAWESRYPRSLLDIAWLSDAIFNKFVGYFYRPYDRSGIILAIALISLLIGCIRFCRNRFSYFLVLVMPVLLTLIAAFLQQYPFRNRLILFLAPFVILMVAEGISFFVSHFRHRILKLIGVLLAISLLILPAGRAAIWSVQPIQVEEVRPLAAYLQSQWQPGDRLYVYNLCSTQFLYYAPRYGFAPDDYQIGEFQIPRTQKPTVKDLAAFKQDVTPLRNRDRLWFLTCRADEIEAWMTIYLKQIGQQHDQQLVTGASLQQYDLRPEKLP